MQGLLLFLCNITSSITEGYLVLLLLLILNSFESAQIKKREERQRKDTKNIWSIKKISYMKKQGGEFG
jgi:hypothetical protein